MDVACTTATSGHLPSHLESLHAFLGELRQERKMIHRRVDGQLVLLEVHILHLRDPVRLEQMVPELREALVATRT